MKTKLQIIQQLLDDRKVTAEEAMILMQTEKEYVYIPNPFPDLRPWHPYYGWQCQPGIATSGEFIVSSQSFN